MTMISVFANLFVILYLSGISDVVCRSTVTRNAATWSTTSNNATLLTLSVQKAKCDTTK